MSDSAHYVFSSYLPRRSSVWEIIIIIIWFKLARNENYQMDEFDWLKLILKFFSHFDWHLDQECFAMKLLQTKLNCCVFSYNNIYSWNSKKPDKKKTLEELHVI